MDRLIEEINDMKGRDALAMLNDGIDDVINHGYSAGVVILADVDDVDVAGHARGVITGSGLTYIEVISLLQSSILKLCAEANIDMDTGIEGDDDVC